MSWKLIFFYGHEYIGSSFSWRSITKVTAILNNRFIARVVFVHISDTTDLQICEVVQSDIWNFNILATQIPTYIKLEMQSIILNNIFIKKINWLI